MRPPLPHLPAAGRSGADGNKLAETSRETLSMPKTGEIVTQKCNDCGKEKPLDRFPREAKGVKRYRSTCSACRARYMRQWRERNYERHLEGHRLDRLMYKASGYMRAYRNRPRNRRKDAVRLCTFWAMRAGFIRRKYNCEKCGIDARHARLFMHHLDYNDPFNVVWLCGVCHGEAHQKQLD